MICLFCKKEIPDDSAYCNHCGKRQEKKKVKHRRAKGTGTVRKRGLKWVALLPDTRKYLGSYDTKRDAENALSSVQLTSLVVESKYRDITFKELADEWVSTRAYTKLSDSGKRWMKSGIAHLSELNDKKFSTIRRNDWQKQIDKAEDEGLSRSTLSAIKSVCTTLSEYAIVCDVIPHSYATKLILPGKEKKTYQIFSDEEIEKIMSSQYDDIKILLYTGMRLNELLNLKTEDIKDGIIHLHGTKTDAAERLIPVHEKIRKILQKRNGTYVIERNGHKVRDDVFRKEFYYPALEDLCVSKIVPHGCRHWFFSQLDKNCDDKYGMSLVGGHTDPSFTEKVYVTADIDRLKKVINSLH